MPIRVLLVDDQALLRAGFRMVLDAQPDIQVVGEAADGVEALAALSTRPVDVVLMDVRMPRLDGVEATRQIRNAGEDDREQPKVLILTTFDLDEYAFSALRAGASGFLLKDAPPDELLAALRAVHAGDAVIAPPTTRRLLDRFAALLPARSGTTDRSVLDQLTGRERDVLILVARGLTNTGIADRLGVSEGTVKTHLGRILAKLQVRDRVQAVVLAYESGLVQAGGNGVLAPQGSAGATGDESGSSTG